MVEHAKAAMQRSDLSSMLRADEQLKAAGLQHSSVGQELYSKISQGNKVTGKARVKSLTALTARK